MHSKRSSLFRAQAKRFPTIPAILDDIKIEEGWALTASDGRFLLKHKTVQTAKKPFTNIIFCSESGLKGLRNSRTFGADGTFSSTAKLFVYNFKLLVYFAR